MLVIGWEIKSRDKSPADHSEQNELTITDAIRSSRLSFKVSK